MAESLLAIAACAILAASIPGLALALLFNGTLIYFYVLYKLDISGDSFSTGMFYGVLAVGYLGGGMVGQIRSGKTVSLRRLDLAFLLFWSWVVASFLMFGTGNPAATRKVTFAPLLVLGPYVGTRLLGSFGRLERFYRYCLLCGAVLLAGALYELSEASDLTDAPRFSMYQTTSGVDNPILFGTTFAIVILIILGRTSAGAARWRWSEWLLAPAAMFLVLRSGSRGAVVSLLAALGSYVAVGKGKSSKRRLVIAAGLFATGLAAWNLIPGETRAGYLYTLTPEAREDPVSSMEIRLEMWDQAIGEFLSAPIAGIGEGNAVAGLGFPHNVLIEVAAELGLIGVASFGTLCVLAFREAKRVADLGGSTEIPMRCALMLYVFALVEAMFSGYVTAQSGLFMSIGLIATIGEYTDGEARPVARTARQRARHLRFA